MEIIGEDKGFICGMGYLPKLFLGGNSRKAEGSLLSAA